MLVSDTIQKDMSVVMSAPEPSSLLMPDPPLEEVKNVNTDTKALGDKSGEDLDFEHDDEDDDDELEALRMAALQSRKPKQTCDEPAYTLKQHPHRNNLTQIVLGGGPLLHHQPEHLPANIPSVEHPVVLPDTSLPPPGYTHLR